MKGSIHFDSVIMTVRGHKVILDSDLARIYGVTAKRLNEQLRRNRGKFPPDFAFQLTAGEFADLRSRPAREGPEVSSCKSVPSHWSQFATSSSRHRGASYRPWAFTEHGALQAANILESDRATAMSVYVIRAFVKMREQLAANAAILKRLAEIDKTLLTHDVALRGIYRKLRPLLAPPPEPKRREIGFHAKPAPDENAAREKSRANLRRELR